MNSKLTPLMRQYWDVKAAHADKILLFRMGDFFEIFHDDALTAAPVLGIALTKRNQKSADETPMCGVPHHSIGGYINKLLKAGFKVAICDQIEDPKFAKGIVKRAVTRILSPGMVYDPDTLDQLQPNYLATFDKETIAFADTSTGEAFYYRAEHPATRSRLLDVLKPTELVLTTEQMVTPPAGPFHISGFDFEIDTYDAPATTQRLRAYVKHMQGGVLNLPLEFEERKLVERLELTQNTLTHLEIFETNRGVVTGSLFSVVNKTKTPGGARRLRSWLAFPLANLELIMERQNEIKEWHARPGELAAIREKLQSIGDLERRSTRLTVATANSRDLMSLKDSLSSMLELPVELPGTHTKLTELAQEISRTIVDEPPHAVRDGHMIKRGVSEELDRLIQMTEDSQSLLNELEQREKSRTGISSLKVKYNNVFGYSIEVTHTHKEKIPADYRRTQTLAQAERYVTDELEALERNILSAQGRRVEVEFQIFESLKQKVITLLPIILDAAQKCNHLDAVAGLAWLALEANFAAPIFNIDDGIHIQGSRHPVVEKFSAERLSADRRTSQPFVANDLHMAHGDCMILTGPNMAGKSTLMRQVALTSILAQIGSFVPARGARLPIFRKILTRIGASDSLSEGLSTFMVEMKETAELIAEADRQSLVILDEVGRGTSTFDGMSLAQAILEHLLTHNRATIFFATHYHELTHLETVFPHVFNFHMGIKEKAGELSFLYTLKSGPANRSYGIHVAKLAGLPKPVISRAEKILAGLESEKPQLSLFVAKAMDTQSVADDVPGELETLVSELKQLSIDSTTPLDALNFVAKWRQALRP